MFALSSRRRFLYVAAAFWVSLGVGLTGAAHGQGAPVSVAVTDMGDDPQVDALRKGIRDELAARGFKGDRLQWQYLSAENDFSKVAQIARGFIDAKPDVIVAIHASAHAVASATREVPLVYVDVFDPVASLLVSGMEASTTNVTGVAGAVPLAEQIALIRKVVPSAKRVGMVFHPGDRDSVKAVQTVQAALARQGMALVTAEAPERSAVGDATRSLVGKVDVIYTAADSTVHSSYEALIAVANEARIPVVAALAEDVSRGAVAALVVDDYDLGRQGGALVARILGGEAPGAIASEYPRKLAPVLNLSAAKAQGVTLAGDFVQSARQTFP